MGLGREYCRPAGGQQKIFDSWTPVQVVGHGGTRFLTIIKAIALGDDHTLALKADGTLWAWGENKRGQMGDNDSELIQKTPVQVLGPDGVGYLDMGTGYDPGTCPVRILGTPAFCFEDIQSAYDSAYDEDVIQIQTGDFPGDLVLDRSIGVTLDGGYDSLFESVVGSSCIRGSLVILDGCVILNGITIGAGRSKKRGD